ncbi:selenocysteine lyase/cysteine desulfurase [Streptosporangium album]|uniref:Selenocysteine lyase/cysteine desulfurase n=1 Tax=Streptosporangium album TaxID=47479 RepID=A0A7W7WE54_9ACTN|nr:aminotransferase class V-fold PLP-dependent enzyme [Streptosporangium album]MBB4943543.1 selenocysteine lyase/cysteine desulfurase [Streptosporangium album]
MNLARAQTLWDPDPGWLNTASYGLPPRPAFDDLQRALSDWRAGRTDWTPWDAATDRARAAFATLVGVDTHDVAVGATVSQMLSPLAAALPPGTRVLVAAPADDIIAAARAHDALTVVDATQACGWLPVDATHVDMLVCAAYKWLMAPRGAAYAYLSPRARERMRPIAANWYAGADPGGSYYGPPLRLAEGARAFDLSPAWFSQIGAAAALDLLNQIGIPAVHAHNTALADRFLTALDQPPTGSAIVTVDVPGAHERLRAAGIRAAIRAGKVRASFHLYTTVDDVDRATEALTS